MKKLFKVLYLIRPVVLGVVIAIGIVLALNIWAAIEGSSYDLLLIVYLTLEFTAGIAYLIMIKHVKNAYERVYPPEPKSIKPDPTYTKPGPPVEEKPLKAHTGDDIVEDVKVIVYRPEFEGKTYQFRIYSDGRVYNMLTNRYIGFKYNGKQSILDKEDIDMP